MTAPDPEGREACCGAPRGHHWEDCPEWRFHRAGGYWYRPNEGAKILAAIRKGIT